MTEETIYNAALRLNAPAERAAYLDQACRGNSALRRRIEVRLRAHEATCAVSSDGQPPPDATLAAQHPQEDGQVLGLLQPPRGPESLGRLAHYEVLRVLGKGGFGTVLEAFDEKLHRVVAIKVLAPALAANPVARQRFLREARTAARVRHEHVIDIHAVDEEPIPYLVMEHVEGKNLQEKINESGPLETGEIVRIGHEIASGLAAAHKQGLIHRDIKPANILLEGEGERVKITDFGLARAADDASITQSGTIAGTPMYMAPEQASGEPVDHRADLFSLGSTLYAMATGQPPFRAATTMAVLKQVCEKDPRPIREINPRIPEWLGAVISRLQAKRPEDRFRSAKELADLLMRQRGNSQPHEQVAPPAPASREPLASPIRRPPWAVMAVGAGLAALAVGGGIYLAALQPAPTGRVAQAPPTGSEPPAVTGKGDEKPPPQGHQPGPFAPLDSEWVKKVRAMKAEDQVKAVVEELKRRNPGFDGKVETEFDDGQVTGLGIGSPAVTDLTPVQVLSHLQRLRCAGCKVTNLAQLAGMASLSRLSLSDNPVKDLRPLAGLKNLSELELDGTAVEDLSPLRGLPLRGLHFYDTAVRDLSPLRGMPLEWLRFQNTRVEDISPLAGMPLGILAWDRKNERDLPVLRQLPLLEEIDLEPADRFWKDADPKHAAFLDWCKTVGRMKPEEQVEAVKKELARRNPDFKGNVKTTQVEDRIAGLELNGDEVMDLAPVAALRGLRSLGCAGSAAGQGKVRSLLPLAGLRLEGLNCSNNPALGDLQPIQNMPLHDLYLNGTAVRSLAPIQDCRSLGILVCYATAIKDLKPVKDLPLTEITCDFDPLRDAPVLKEIRTLETINGQAAADFLARKKAP